MPIPLLVYGIGAAVAGLATAVAVKAFSDDDKPSSSSGSSESDDAARRRKEEAEKERKERERNEKREAANDAFQKQGRAFGKSLGQALPADLVEASFRRGVALDFDLKKGRMRFNLEDAVQRDEQLFTVVELLNTILTKRASHQKTIENLITFSELYKPTFQGGTELQKRAERMRRLDGDIEDLKEVKRQLTKLESELTSAMSTGRYSGEASDERWR